MDPEPESDCALRDQVYNFDQMGKWIEDIKMENDKWRNEIQEENEKWRREVRKWRSISVLLGILSLFSASYSSYRESEFDQLRRGRESS